MNLEGDTFRHLSLPGLDCSSATLLAAICPGNWILQVTPAALRVLRAPGGAAPPGGGGSVTREWRAAGAASGLPRNTSISMAAVGDRGEVVLSCGVCLICLAVAAGSGAVRETGRWTLGNQTSALAVLQVGSTRPQP